MRYCEIRYKTYNKWRSIF